MHTRPLGQTGLDVSALGFGGMRFGDIDDPERCAALVRAAYDAGVNFFDTAPGYFEGKSEERFGLAFRDMAKTRAERPFYVCTKTFADNPAAVRAECERSLRRLGVERIDVYYMWCILSLDAFRERTVRDTLREFEKLRDEGLIGHIGVSTHLAGDDIGRVLDAYPFEVVLLGYSALNFAYREAGVRAAAARGAGVVVMNPLAGGAIPEHPDRFAFLADASGSVAGGALSFLWSDPAIHSALVGLADERQLGEAVAAMDRFAPWPAARVAEVRRRLGRELDALCTGCGYCEDCPGGLPIPKLMDAYNQYVLSGKTEPIGDRLAWHWGIAADGHRLDACVECGACEAACTQHLPIMARLKEVDAARRAHLARRG